MDNIKELRLTLSNKLDEIKTLPHQEEFKQGFNSCANFVFNIIDSLEILKESIRATCPYSDDCPQDKSCGCCDLFNFN